ncbi:MAG: hypothetical protein A4E53_02387 [Pelotomaculum sp. PtaB.Bin104]|nr:MAG: hypothetical protein A4E53_02387 [Pelotomaculum sp. PtaB.Bin104]
MDDNKVLEAVELLKKADAALREVVSVLQIYKGVGDKIIKVHVSGLRDLEKVPGEVEFVPWNCEGSEYDQEARKYCGGVMFFCLIGGEEEDIAEDL